MISGYAMCFVIGFGSVMIFMALFSTGYWLIEKMYEFYLNWRNPWRNLESSI